MKIKNHKNYTKEFFPITSVCQDDIIHAFTDNPNAQEIARNLDDEDMKNLASNLADNYCEILFWESLKAIFELEFLTPEVPSIGVTETECPACKKMIISDLSSSEVQCCECKVIVLQRHINLTEYQED